MHKICAFRLKHLCDKGKINYADMLSYIQEAIEIGLNKSSNANIDSLFKSILEKHSSAKLPLVLYPINLYLKFKQSNDLKFLKFLKEDFISVCKLKDVVVKTSSKDDSLEKYINKNMHLLEKKLDFKLKNLSIVVVPSLINGFVIEVGTNILDRSLLGKLNYIKDKMLHEV